MFVQAALQGTPQYAYRKHTSTLGALRRASGHCRMVRHVLARQVDTAKQFNQPMRELVGGLMVSLDLSKAFDCLSYSEMYSSLLEVNVPESLAVAIMHLHHNTVLTIQHKGHGEQIGVQRGLRQGCGIAPIVYAAWTVKLRRQLDTALGRHWTAAHLSLFADDKHGFWAIEALRISIGHFISIQSTKMRINFTKSCALLGLKGRAQQKIMHTKVRQWNGVSCLMVPIFSGTISIPLSESMLYLGTKLSYGKFEVQTGPASSPTSTSQLCSASPRAQNEWTIRP